MISSTVPLPELDTSIVPVTLTGGDADNAEHGIDVVPQNEEVTGGGSRIGRSLISGGLDVASHGVPVQVRIAHGPVLPPVPDI